MLWQKILLVTYGISDPLDVDFCDLLTETSRLRDEDYQSKNRGQGDGQQAVSTPCNGSSVASPVKRLKRYLTNFNTCLLESTLENRI